MSEEKYIVCVPWGEESVPSERFHCCQCNRQVAVDRRNVPLCKEVTKICVLCASKKFGDRPSEDFGALMAGELKPMNQRALERFRNLYKQVN